MKYVVIDELRKGTGDIWTAEFDDEDKAIEKAKNYWHHLTREEKKKRTVYVLESANPDEEAQDHLDGDPVFSTDQLYTAFRETGTFIDAVDSIEDGIKLIRDYEITDKIEGDYTEDFYDVVDIDHCSVL